LFLIGRWYATSRAEVMEATSGANIDEFAANEGGWNEFAVKNVLVFDTLIGIYFVVEDDIPVAYVAMNDAPFR
jgi:hypothetical protein